MTFHPHKLDTSSILNPLSSAIAMETLSSSVSISTFRPSATATALPLPTFKPPSSSNHHRNPNLPSRRNSISNQQQSQIESLQPKIKTTPTSPTRENTQPQPPILSKTRASSGYAAALLDISLCNNSSNSVFADVNRFANLIRAKPVLELMRNPFINAVEKNQALTELTEHGKFEKHLTALLKMLIMKNKFAMIGDVLDEFGRMYCELCIGSQNVVSKRCV